MTTHSAGPSHPTGKVTFYDNDEKIGAVTEHSSGSVTLKVKIKAGINLIEAVYGGDATYLSSSGHTTVTGKA